MMHPQIAVTMVPCRSSRATEDTIKSQADYTTGHEYDEYDRLAHSKLPAYSYSSWHYQDPHTGGTAVQQHTARNIFFKQESFKTTISSELEYEGEEWEEEG